MLTDLGIIFTSYLGLGRTGAIASSFYLQENVVLTLMTALMLDFFQIPVYGIFLENSSKKTAFGRKISGWLERKRGVWEERIAADGFWAKLSQLQPLAVILVAIVPVRGCGIVSACVLCFILGFSRLYSTLLIMGGSLLGAGITLALLYEPMRLLHG